MKFTRIAVLAVAGALLTGCAAMNAASARHRYIHSQTEQHSYARPLQAVWPEARQLLFEQGYEVKDTGEAGVFTLETEWKTTDNDRTRYLVQGLKIDDRSSRVKFTLVRQGRDAKGSWMNGSTGRDLAIEWLLLQRVDPAKADQIKAAANQAGEAARTQS